MRKVREQRTASGLSHHRALPFGKTALDVVQALRERSDLSLHFCQPGPTAPAGERVWFPHWQPDPGPAVMTAVTAPGPYVFYE